MFNLSKLKPVHKHLAKTLWTKTEHVPVPFPSKNQQLKELEDMRQFIARAKGYSECSARCYTEPYSASFIMLIESTEKINNRLDELDKKLDQLLLGQ